MRGRVTLLVFLTVFVMAGAAAAGPPGPTIASAAGGASTAQTGTGSPKPESAAEGGESGGSTKSWVERLNDVLINIFKLAAALIGAILTLVGAFLLVLVVLRRRASLTIEPFADGGVEKKVGSAVAALVAGRLSAVSRAKRERDPNDGYRLDLVVADVELLASSKSLDNALSGLGETSQFKLLVAILGLIGRLVGTNLTAKGELAPKGGQGFGLMVAMHSEKDGVLSSATLWKASSVEEKDPTPYYDLAEPAAAWVQYEAARAVNSFVETLTSSAESFSLLCEGLDASRAGEWTAAGERYVEALEVDRKNVGALVNLSLLLAREQGRFAEAILLLARAKSILKDRYREWA